jgi:hypothetical protein
MPSRTEVWAESLTRGKAMASIAEMKMAWHFDICTKLPDRRKGAEMRVERGGRKPGIAENPLQKHEMLM